MKQVNKGDGARCNTDAEWLAARYCRRTCWFYDVGYSQDAACAAAVHGSANARNPQEKSARLGGRTIVFHFTPITVVQMGGSIFVTF